jgi:hypothetical protein
MLHSIFHQPYSSIYLARTTPNSAPFKRKLFPAWRNFVSAGAGLRARNHDHSLEGFNYQGRAL